jgi:hypothetical protein
MAYKRGEEMVIKWKTKLLLGKLSANFDGSMKEIDVTNDSSAGFEEMLAGDLGGSVSFSGVYDPTHASGQGANDLIADFLAKGSGALTFGGATPTTDKAFTGTAYITKCAIKGSHGDKATCDVSFKFTGAYTFVAVT